MSRLSASAGGTTVGWSRRGRRRVDGEVVYTLGTSNRSADELVMLLRDLGAQVMVDVRRFPRSRYGHFNQAELAPCSGVGVARS